MHATNIFKVKTLGLSVLFKCQGALPTSDLIKPTLESAPPLLRKFETQLDLLTDVLLALLQGKQTSLDSRRGDLETVGAVNGFLEIEQHAHLAAHPFDIGDSDIAAGWIAVDEQAHHR